MSTESYRNASPEKRKAISAKNAEAARIRRARLAAEGRCICGEPLKPGRRQCVECLGVAAEKARLRTAKKRAAREAARRAA